MKRMNYQNASLLALKKFEWARKVNMPYAIELDAQFRKLTVLESSGYSDNLTYVLFEIEFCGKEGNHYRTVWIRVRNSDVYGMDAELDTSSIMEVK